MGNYATPADDSEFVELADAGEPSKGEFHCASCGYGVTVTKTLPMCPMCAGSHWQRTAWSPFHRSTEAAGRSELAGL